MCRMTRCTAEGEDFGKITFTLFLSQIAGRERGHSWSE